jgi:hypothetical protein
MTDFDVLARLRSLEAKLGTALDRIGQLERTAKRYRDTPEYRREHQGHIAAAGGMVGFWSQLTDEQKAAALAYRGPENHGDPAFLEKREQEISDHEALGCMLHVMRHRDGND